MWALAGSDPPNQGSADNAFPICRTVNDFESQVGRGRLQGVTGRACALIENLQPYKSGQPFDSHPLGLLSGLANIDKHRMVLLTTVLAPNLQYNIAGLGSGSFFGSVHRDGAELLGVNPNQPIADLEMQITSSVLVAFSEPALVADADVVGVLKNLLRFVQ